MEELWVTQPCSDHQGRCGCGWVTPAGCVPSAPHDPQGEAPSLPGSNSPPSLNSTAGPGSSEQHRELVLCPRHKDTAEQGHEEATGASPEVLSEFSNRSRAEPLDAKEKHIFWGKEEGAELCKPPSQAALVEGCALHGSVC